MFGVNEQANGFQGAEGPDIMPAEQQLQSVRLTQGEKLRLSKLRQGLTQVQEQVDNKELYPHEGVELASNIQSAIEPLQNRMMQEMGLQRSAAIDEAMHQAALAAQTVTGTRQHQANTLPQRVVTLANQNGVPTQFTVDHRGNAQQLFEGQEQPQGQDGGITTNNPNLVHQLYQMAEQHAGPLPPGASSQAMAQREQWLHDWVTRRLGMMNSHMAPQQQQGPTVGQLATARMLQSFPGFSQPPGRPSWAPGGAGGGGGMETPTVPAWMHIDPQQAMNQFMQQQQMPQQSPQGPPPMPGAPPGGPQQIIGQGPGNTLTIDQIRQMAAQSQAQGAPARPWEQPPAQGQAPQGQAQPGQQSQGQQGQQLPPGALSHQQWLAARSRIMQEIHHIHPGAGPDRDAAISGAMNSAGLGESWSAYQQGLRGGQGQQGQGQQQAPSLSPEQIQSHEAMDIQQIRVNNIPAPEQRALETLAHQVYAGLRQYGSVQNMPPQLQLHTHRLADFMRHLQDHPGQSTGVLQLYPPQPATSQPAAPQPGAGAPPWMGLSNLVPRGIDFSGGAGGY